MYRRDYAGSASYAGLCATETTIVTSHLLTKNMASPQIASIGKPMPCADIGVMDENGIEVPRGMTGGGLQDLFDRGSRAQRQVFH
jgi:hypothetical protein